MCLIVFAYRVHPKYRFVLAANRDEFYDRPTAPAHYWEDAPHVLAGRDLLKMGTWMGVTTNGRFAALTNYRDPREDVRGKRSRGEVVADFLKCGQSPAEYMSAAAKKREQYPGYNLLAGNLNKDELYFYSNVENNVRMLTPGIYGVSNHLLDTEWPKVVRAKQGLTDAIRGDDADLPERLFDVLQDETRAPDEALPSSGVSLEWERLLSPVYIRSRERNYGTRSSTVILATEEEAVFRERVSSQDGTEDRHFTIPIVQ